MSEIHLYLSILFFSVVVQNIVASKRAGLINPVLFFSAINYLHNWSSSVAELFSKDFVRGYVLVEVTDALWAKTLLMALVAQWIFFLVFIYFTRSQEDIALRPIIIKTIGSINIERLKICYILFLLAFIGFSLVFGERQAYGSGTQAATAIEGFSPLHTLLGLRVFILGFILICDGLAGRKKFPIIFLLTEGILATISGGRKMVFLVLLMYVFSLLLKGNSGKIEIKNSKKILLLISSGIVGIFLVVFVLLVRTGMNPLDAFLFTITSIFSGPEYLFSALAASNSQALQAWVIDLVDSGKMEILYGKSYLQAIINTVVLRPFQGPIADWQAAFAFKTVAYPNINNHGWDFCFAGETYLNFGNFFWLPYLVFSIVMNKLFYSKYKSLFKFFLCIGTYAICFVAFRSDTTALFRHLSLFIAAFFLMKILFGLRIRKNPLARNGCPVTHR